MNNHTFMQASKNEEYDELKNVWPRAIYQIYSQKCYH